MVAASGRAHHGAGRAASMAVTKSRGHREGSPAGGGGEAAERRRRGGPRHRPLAAVFGALFPVTTVGTASTARRCGTTKNAKTASFITKSDQVEPADLRPERGDFVDAAGEAVRGGGFRAVPGTPARARCTAAGRRKGARPRGIGASRPGAGYPPARQAHSRFAATARRDSRPPAGRHRERRLGADGRGRCPTARFAREESPQSAAHPARAPRIALAVRRRPTPVERVARRDEQPCRPSVTTRTRRQGRDRRRPYSPRLYQDSASGTSENRSVNSAIDSC